MKGSYGMLERRGLVVYIIFYLQIDRPLITELVERWRPGTHTFHLPPGEMIITLEDIKVSGAVKVDGLLVIQSELGETPFIRKGRVQQYFGKTPLDTDYDQNGLLSFSWLAAEFLTLSPGADEDTARCYARALILTLIGSQFFQDKKVMWQQKGWI